MKKILLLFGLLCLAINGSAQTQTENYVFSTTCLTADCVKRMEVIQYSDGLGRPKQILNVGASPSGKDVVTHIEYDGMGRQVRDYLPVPQSGISTREIYSKTNATDATLYGSEKIYGEKVIENSPLGRVRQQVQPGNDWQTHPVKFDYMANENNEVLRYSTITGIQNGVNYAQSLIINGYYSKNLLYKNKVTDEDGNNTYEYKNVQGQTLLIRKRVQIEPEEAPSAGPGGPGISYEDVDTYYVYNQYDQLAFVITPMASRELKANPVQTITYPSDNALIRELCYQYRYDGRERLVEKKLPGKGWEYFVYDKQDRLIMTQDANMGTYGYWTFAKFDQYGRPAYSGLCDPGAGNRNSTNLLPDAYRQSQQTAADNVGSNNVYRSNDLGTNYDEIRILYTVDNTYPAVSSVRQLLTLNYYDKYPTLYDSNISGEPDLPVREATILGQKTLTDDAQNSKLSTKGLPVASYVKNVDEQSWTKTFIWYDELGREIGTSTINHLGGRTISYSLLDFTGAVQRTETWHNRVAAEAPVHIVEDFVYDDHKRLLKHYHEVVGRTPKELLAENHYNEKDQVDWKNTGTESNSDFTALSAPLQQVFYDYNIRNWMTGINLRQDDASRPLDPARLFSYKIRYNNPVNTNIASYNGNITEVDWSYEGEDGNRYEYTYDGLNRLLKADHKSLKTTGTLDARHYNEQLSYDLNGNIHTLKRNARPQNTAQTGVLVDNLSYTYENGNLSNKLSTINDSAQNTSGYPGGGGTMTYDNNGNMLTMPDKGITQGILYNHMNLPKQVKQGSNDVNYTYRADGVKVHKQFLVNGQSIDTDYLDGFVYTTPYSSKLDDALLDNPEKTLAGQPEAFELEQKVIVEPGEPGIPMEAVSSPDFFPTAEGFYDYKNSKYIYQYKDHLGNVRLSYERSAEDGSVAEVSRNNYYPFGLNHINITAKTGHTVYNPSVSFENWKYNGKELEETGLYDYGARFYMPDIGRWGQHDPLSEITLDPFGYVYNNPLFYNDPTGMEGEDAAADYANAGGGNDGGPGGGGSYEPDKGTGPNDKWHAMGYDYFFRRDSNSGGNGGEGGANNSAGVLQGSGGGPGPKKNSGKMFPDWVYSLFKDSDTKPNPLKEYRAWRDNPNYNPGESKMDRIFRLMNSAHIEIMADEGSGGGLMYSSGNGLSRTSSMASKVAAEAKMNGFNSFNKGINPAIVAEYLEQMSADKFTKPIGVSGFKWNGKFYFMEGNHRMNAAIQYKIKTGSHKYMDILMKNAKFDKANPSAYGKVRKFPVKSSK